MRRAPWPVTVAVLLATAATGGCGAPHEAARVRSNQAACAQILPLASAAVRHRGRLVQIRQLSAHDLGTLLGQPSAAPTSTARTAPPSGHRPSPVAGAARRVGHALGFAATAPACLVVYQDDYRPGDVGAAPRAAGRYAIVIARIRPPMLLRIWVSDRLPRLRSHRTIP